MVKKPQTAEELLADEQQHPNRGKINGEYVADIGTTELSIFIDGDLYNKLIQIRGAIGLTKSQLAQESVFAALRFLKQLTGNQGITIDLSVEGKSNFRGNVPRYAYERVLSLGELHRLDKRQATYLGLYLFANDPVIQDEYKLFIDNRATQLNSSVEEVQESLYGLSKALSRKERIKLLSSGDSSANEPKMNI
jgi:hypothetical protein